MASIDDTDLKPRRASARKTKSNSNEQQLVIAERLRTLRKARSMTIGMLASNADLSVGVVSQIERGLGNPSMKTLQRLASALQVTLWSLFERTQPELSKDPPFVRRAPSRPKMAFGRHRLIKELLSLHDDRLRFMLITMPPQSESENVLIARGEKGGLILSGKVELTVGGEVAILDTGDSFQFPSDQQHKIANRTDNCAQLLWIMSVASENL